MPRQRGGSAPRRPTAAPAKPTAAPAPAPARHSSTAAAPPPQAAAPPPPMQQAAPAPQASQGPGLFGQMASTAAGVAVGSSIGHAVGGWFSGGSSSDAPAPAQQQSTDFAQQHQQAANYSNGNASGACQAQIGDFRKCMDENQGSLNICGWYLDQLKACQSAASQY